MNCHLVLKIAELARLAVGVLLSLSFAAEYALAIEKIGELKVTDFLLEPQFSYSEHRTGSFDSGSSLLAVGWERDKTISGQIKLGSKSLLGVPARHLNPNSDDFSLIEGFAQIDTIYGRVRLGVLPVPFGLEGGSQEGRLRFPRSLFFQRRVLGLRDYGVAYAIENQGFKSDWVIHHGESGPDLDGQTWFSARWAWLPRHGSQIGISAATGRTSVASTNPDGTAQSQLAGLLVDEPSKQRVGNFFFEIDQVPFSFSIEASLGEIIQDSDLWKFSSGHIDMYYSLESSVGFLARYDEFDPRVDRSGDKIMEATLGISFRAQYETSVLYLLGTRVMQENVKPDAHRVLVVWRLTPNISLRR